MPVGKYTLSICNALADVFNMIFVSPFCLYSLLIIMIHYASTGMEGVSGVLQSKRTEWFAEQDYEI